METEAKRGSTEPGLPGLRRARLNRLLSQRGLSAISGVTQATISNLETGRHMPAGLTIAKLARALEVDDYELMEE